MRFVFVFCLFVYCMTSCFEKNVEEGIIKYGSVETINIVPNRLKKLSLSLLIADVKIIPLETTSLSLLAGISKVEIDDGYIFVQNMKDKLIYVFDLNGRFKHRIGCKGNGPGEIQFPGCFSLDKKDNKVYLSDNYNSIYKYDYNGEFVSKEELRLFYNNFVIPGDGFIYYHASKMVNYSPISGEYICWNLWMKDCEKDKFRTCFKYDSELYPNGSTYFDTKTPFSVLDSYLTYHYVFCDTIYSISNGEISPKYILDYGKNKPKVNLGNLPGEDALKYLLSENDDQVYYLHDVIETSSFIKFKYLINKQVFDAFYLKDDKKVVDGVLENDILGGQIAFLYGFGSKIIGVIEPSEIEINSKNVSFLNDSILNVLKNMNEDANPILVECVIN